MVKVQLPGIPEQYAQPMIRLLSVYNKSGSEQRCKRRNSTDNKAPANKNKTY